MAEIEANGDATGKATGETPPDILNNVNAQGIALPIDPLDPTYKPLLDNLQGNILKGHGREHAVLFFIEFNTQQDQGGLRGAFGEVAREYVTSAAQQEKWRTEFKKYGFPGGLFGNVLLTAKGYQALGFSQDEIAYALREAVDPGLKGPKDEPLIPETHASFLSGMQNAKDELNDPPGTDWEPGYQDSNKVHALFLIADDEGASLMRAAHRLADKLGKFSTITQMEHGAALRNDAGQGIEHFGYVDGRSQPLYVKALISGTDKPDIDEDGGTIKVWNPAEPLSRVLVTDGLAAGTPDIGRAQEANAFGSFFVYRKLEQDVRGFKKNEQVLADVMNTHREAAGIPILTGDQREIAGALVIGRFEDGTPVALSPKDGFKPLRENDFTYVSDPDGAKCPFASHIRKSNPRGDIIRRALPLLPSGTPLPPGTPAQLENRLERSRRITRRAIPFGPPIVPEDVASLDDLPTFSPGGSPEDGVGLLFMCFQSSIASQFAFIQRNWVNNADFVVPGVGVDGVIGQKNTEPSPSPQNWPVQYGVSGCPRATLDFSDFVRLQGGEFFFAPSLPFFQSL